MYQYSYDYYNKIFEKRHTNGPQKTKDYATGTPLEDKLRCS